MDARVQHSHRDRNKRRLVRLFEVVNDGLRIGVVADHPLDETRVLGLQLRVELAEAFPDKLRMALVLGKDDGFADAVAACRARGGRVVAVGTTSVRSLESAARDGVLKPFSGDTDIFIYPGRPFHVVDALVTNFHLPRSTLMMLVSAFAGYAPVMGLYRHAMAQQYRFFSYGDAMLLERSR